MVDEEPRALPQSDRIPFALAACFALSAAMMTIFPIISPDVVLELGLNSSETGIITAAYLLGYAIFQIPASVLGVRIGPGRVLCGATLVMSAAAIAACLLNSLSGWVIARFVMGVGGAAVLPLSIQLLIDLFCGPRLLKGLGIFIAGWGTGITVSMIGAAPLLEQVGWRSVLIMSALLGLGVLVILRRVLPPDRPRAGRPSVNFQNPKQIVRTLGRNYTLIMMGIINVAGTSSTVCLLAWAPAYLTSAFGASTAQVSASLSPIGVAMTLGAWAGGKLTVLAGWRAIVVASLLTSSVLIALIPLQSSGLAITALAVVVGVTGMLFAAPVQSLLAIIVPGELAGVAAAYYNTLGFLGAFAVPLIFGLTVDWMSFEAGWIFCAGVVLAGILAAMLIPVTRNNSVPVVAKPEQ